MSAVHVPPVDLLFDMQAGKRLPYCHNAHAQSVKVNVHHDKFSHYFDVLHSKSLLFVHFSVKDY